MQNISGIVGTRKKKNCCLSKMLGKILIKKMP